MTTQVASVSVDSIFSLVQRLSLSDKTTLLNALLEETGLSVFLGTHQTVRNISMQINGLSNAGMADVMNAIAESLRTLTLRRTPRTAQGFVEPLLAVGEALPLHMLLVPGGTLLMGQTEAEKAELIRQVGEEEDYKKYYGRELPQHGVTVPQFFMGRYPVTQAQWRVVAAMPQVKSELQPDPSRFKGDNRPVERVNWYDAVEFCARLSAHTSRQYRLPSEAEWEYACRAGTTTPFYFGNTLTTEMANYNGNSTYADGPKGEYREETTPVDHFGIANAFGLCDMHGNVWEWCQDHFHSDYEGAPTDGSAWVQGGDSERRILRGGSWYFNLGFCRSAYRLYGVPGIDNYDLGFRVCCSAPRTL